MKCFTAALILAALAAAPVSAQDTGAGDGAAAVSWGGDLTISSSYVWRGDVEDGAPSVQPQFWVQLGDVSVSSWMAVSGAGVLEHDTSVEVAHSIGVFGVTGGWTNYFSLDTDIERHADELYASIALPSRITPSVTIWHGVGATSSRYIEAAISSRVRPRGLALELEPRVAAGYDRGRGADRGPTHVEATLGAEWSHRSMAIHPFITYLASLRGAIASRTVWGVQLMVGQ